MPIRTARAGKPTGVWELEALQAAIDRGEVLPTDLVWTSGFPDWKQLSSVAQEIGIMLPAPVGDVPPIPGSEAPVPPPIPKVDSGTQSVTPAEIANFGDLTFRRNASEKSGCRGAMLSLAKILAVVIVGSIALLFVFARIQGKSGSSSSGDQDQAASSSGRIEASAAGLDAFINSLKGKSTRLYLGDGTYANLIAHIDSRGYLRHCNTTNDELFDQCMKSDAQITSTPLQVMKSSDETVWCQSAGDKVNLVARNYAVYYMICVSNRDHVLQAEGVPEELHAVAKAFSVPKGTPYYVLGTADPEASKVESVSYFVFQSAETRSSSSENSASADTQQEASVAQKSEDSGSPECIDISRRWVEARRKADALEGSAAGGFATIELARIQNVERVFAGCKGSESREEQEYVAQHPEEMASRMREMTLKAEAEAASAPKPERDRVFAELISTWGVAGAGWGESSFVVKAKSTVQDPVRQLCPKLLQLAESVGMGITLEYSNEGGESVSTNCPTQAEQVELDAQKAIEDEQRVIAEREARDQKRREDDCASLKAEYDSRVRSVVEESKGRNSPAPRLKQLEELYGDSLRSCANDSRRESAPSDPSTALGGGAYDTAEAGFVVQFGAFPTAAAATSLRDSLRGAGFKAFTDTVTSLS